MLHKFLCKIGLHSWKVTYSDGMKKERKCDCCSATQHTTYDMAYGETNWSAGLHWSQ